MLYIRSLASAASRDPSGRSRVFRAELYEPVGRGERVDWTCDHEHDNRFSALVCGEAELAARALASRTTERRRPSVA